MPPLGRFFELEADNLQMAKKIIEVYGKFYDEISFPLYIMLDNFGPKLIRKITAFLKTSRYYNSIFLEASGGINLRNVKLYANSGVDIISVGALTHSAPALDISLNTHKM